MNHLQNFEQSVKKIHDDGGSRNDTIRLEREYFNQNIMPKIVQDGQKAGLSEDQISANIAKVQSRFRQQTAPTLEKYNFTAPTGSNKNQKALAKDRRTDRAINESAKTGSKLPIIKETILSTGETLGNAFGQGAGRMLEGAARFANDLGENEQGSTLDRIANFGANTANQYERSASTTQRQAQSGEMGLGAKLGVGAVQSAPMMALPFGVAKGGASLLKGLGTSSQLAARGGLAAGLVAGHTQNYGEVRRGATSNLQRDFPTWESLQGNADFQSNLDQALNQGLNLQQARNEAHRKTLDDISEGYADVYGTAMTALDVVLPSEAAMAVAKKLPVAKTRLGRAVTGTDGISSGLVNRALTQQAPRTGLAKLMPDVSWVANKAAMGVVGKEAIQEGLQGGLGEYGSQKASADLGGQSVNYGQIGRQMLEEGAIGGLMGGGLRLASASPVSQAQDVAKNIQQQTANFYQAEAQARQNLAQAVSSGNSEAVNEAQQDLNSIHSEAGNIKAMYERYGATVPPVIQNLATAQGATETQSQPEQQPYPSPSEPSLREQQQQRNAEYYAEHGFDAGTAPIIGDTNSGASQPNREQRQQMNAKFFDTYGNQVPQPVIDGKALSPFDDRIPQPVIDHNAIDGDGIGSEQPIAQQTKPTLANIVGQFRWQQQEQIQNDILNDIDAGNFDLAQQKIMQAQQQGIDVNHAVMRLNGFNGNGQSLSDYYENRSQSDNSEQQVLEQPVTFAEKIADAHINQPELKASLIQEEISAGRPRNEVLKEVSQIIGGLDQQVGEPQAPNNNVLTNDPDTENNTYEPVDQILDGDIGRISDGQPFLNKGAATTYQKKNNLIDSHDIVQIGKAKQFVLRPKTNDIQQYADIEVQTKDQFKHDVAQQQIHTSANEAATSPLNDTPEPSQAQIEAGNYKKGHIKFNGLDITVENPKGSTRSGTDPDGKSWSHEMSDHYGYIKRTTGADNEHIDTYIGSNPDSDHVFIVDQLDQETGNFDEHKVMLGFDSQEGATTAYQSNFDKGWKVGPIRTMNMEQFKDWLKNEDTSKPATEGKVDSEQFTETNQPNDEKQALELYQSLGRDSVMQRHDAISRIARQRMEESIKKKGGFDDSNYTAIDYMTPNERQAFHLLNLALTLGIDPQGEAQQRVKERLEKRRSENTKPKNEGISKPAEKPRKTRVVSNALGVEVGDIVTLPASQDVYGNTKPAERYTVTGINGDDLSLTLEDGNRTVESAKFLKQRYKDLTVEKGIKGKVSESIELVDKVEITHIEGKQSKPATNDVVEKSFDKAEDNLTKAQYDKMRNNLVAEIEQAIANAPVEAEAKQPNEDGDSDYEQITFDVKGDGKFKVRNDKATLTNFLKKVKASAGFKPSKREAFRLAPGKSSRWEDGKQVKYTPQYENNGSRNTIEAIKNMLSDGDKFGMFNAYQMALAADIPVIFIRDRKKVEPYFVIEQVAEVDANPFYLVLRKEPKGTSYLVVSATGGKLADSAGTTKEATANGLAAIKKNGKDLILKALRGERERLNEQDITQEKLKAQFEQVNGIQDGVGIERIQDYSRKTQLKPDEDRTGTSPIDTTFKPLSIVSATRRVLSILQHLKLSTAQDASSSNRINIINSGGLSPFSVQVIASFDGLPATIQQDATYQDENGNTKNYDVSGVWHDGVLYVVADQIYGDSNKQLTTFDAYEELLAHEIIGHFGVQRIFGDEYKTKLQALFNALGGQNGIRKIAKNNGVDMQQFEKAYIEPYTQGAKDGIYAESDVQQALVGELFAFVAQNAKSRPFVSQKLKEVIGYIRQWFRDHGFDQFLSRYNDADVMMFLAEARKAVIERDLFGKFKDQTISKNNSDKLFSLGQSTPKTDTTLKQVRDKLIDHFGNAIITSLEEQGRLNILDTYSESGIEGFYQDGKVTLIADNLNDDTVIPTFLHELGGHAGFQGVLKPQAYQALMDTFNAMVKAGNPIAVQAKNLAEREAIQSTQQLEYLPYLLTVASKQQLGSHAQQSAVSRLINRIVSAVKAWALDKLGVNLKLNTDDMVALAERMVTQLAKGKTSSNSDNQILYSRAAVKETFDKASQTALGRQVLLNAERAKLMPKKVTSLFNTMLHKALTDETGQFKSSFDLVQEKINHVTYDSAASMQVAPDLLTQLEDMGDYWRETKRVASQLWEHTPLTTHKSQYLQDVKTVSDFIFQNTVSDEPKVYTAAELIKEGFSPAQIELYKQARDAVDTSLDSFAKTTVSKIYGYAGASHQQILDLTRRDLPLARHVEVVNREIRDIAEQDPDKANATQEALDNIEKVIERLDSLKKEGYMPLMRFGKYFMRVVDKASGEVALRQHFESEAERNRFVENFKQDNGIPLGFELETGTINELQNKIFAGVSPETVALFMKESGLPTDGIQEDFIKLALRDNHALKRLLKRHKIKGFDEDLKRVLASFVLSNSRYGANQLYNGAIDESVLAIEDGKLQEDATRLRDYALDPQEEVAGIKNFAFVWYMGASLMFGLVNLTQPLLQTFPFLLQYSNKKDVVFKAFGQSLRTMKNGHVIPQKYQKYYDLARREGHLDPQNTWMLQGLERGKSGIGASTWQLISHASGFFAQASETINRRATLFAALDVAKDLGQAKLEQLGFKDEYDFAIRSIQETQGIYNKGNRPRLSRGNVGSLLMMYKQFMIAYLEQMVRMQKSGLWGGQDDEFKRKMAQLVGFGVSRSVLVMLGILWSFSGVKGLPFFRDILDALETAGGVVGKPFNTEREIQIALRSALGDTLGQATTDILLDGAINVNPAMDVQGRMSMGDLIPGSAYFSPLTPEYQKSKELASLGGAVGGLLEKANNAMEFAQIGSYGQAVGQLAPKFATSGYQGISAAITGDYRNPTTGYKTSDATVFEGIVKAADAQPARIAKEGRIRGMEMRDRAAQQYLNERWKERLENALASGDQDRVKYIKQEIKDYNATSPRYPITFQQSRVEKKLEKSNQTWQEKRKNTTGLEWMDELNPYVLN